jgi:hypothetical protein
VFCKNGGVLLFASKNDVNNAFIPFILMQKNDEKGRSTNYELVIT